MMGLGEFFHPVARLALDQIGQFAHPV